MKCSDPTVSLTDRQREVLRLLARRISEHGQQPTIREMMDDLGIASPNGVVSHLRALENKGVIKRQYQRSGVQFPGWRDWAY